MLVNAYVRYDSRRKSACDQFSHEHHALCSGQTRWLLCEVHLGAVKEQ